MNATNGTATEVVPGPAVTNSSLAEFVDTQGWGHHASCSCPIGADGDEMAVLDSAFRVRGTKGLRVVDASGKLTCPCILNADLEGVANKYSQHSHVFLGSSSRFRF